MKNRPVGVTVLAVLAIIYGVLQLLGGLSLIGLTALTIPGIELTGFLESIGIAAGVGSLIVAGLFIAFGVGALGVRSWSWTLGVVLFGLMVILAIVAMFSGGAVAIGAAVAAIVFAAALAYLLTNDVRSAFGHHRDVMRHTGTPVAH